MKKTMYIFILGVLSIVSGLIMKVSDVEYANSVLITGMAIQFVGLALMMLQQGKQKQE